MEINVSDDVIKSMIREEIQKKVNRIFSEEFAVSALSEDVRPNIHARWESDGYGHIFCTACKGAKLNTHKSKFCDSCGAIMDAEVEPNKKGDK